MRTRTPTNRARTATAAGLVNIGPATVLVHRLDLVPLGGLFTKCGEDAICARIPLFGFTKRLGPSPLVRGDRASHDLRSVSQVSMASAIVPCAQIHVVLFLHDGEDPTAGEWSAAMKLIAEFKAKHRDGLTNLRALAVTDGGAPNSVQRKELLVDQFEGRIRSAAVSTALSNRFKRGIATAISWINPGFRAVPPDEFGAALEHLGLAGEGKVLIDGLTKLQAGMPAVETLRIMAQHA